MDRKISDAELDRAVSVLVKNFALQDDELDEIAAAPALLRGVRRRIEEENARRAARGWLTVFRAPAFAFGAAALLLVVGGALAFLFSNSRSNEILTAENQSSVQIPSEIAAPIAPGIDADNSSVEREKNQSINPAPAKVAARRAAAPQKASSKNQSKQTSPKTLVMAAQKEIAPEPAAETKTDFIALGFAANTDSGQIVRVKVPGSMMVSLGLTANVEKESEMVNAEVLVGDDGTARAIRFIR